MDPGVFARLKMVESEEGRDDNRHRALGVVASAIDSEGIEAVVDAFASSPSSDLINALVFLLSKGRHELAPHMQFRLAFDIASALKIHGDLSTTAMLMGLLAWSWDSSVASRLPLGSLSPMVDLYVREGGLRTFSDIDLLLDLLSASGDQAPELVSPRSHRQVLTALLRMAITEEAAFTNDRERSARIASMIAGGDAAL